MDLINDFSDPKKMMDDLANIDDPFDANRKPYFSFLGFSDISVIQFFLGLAFGLFGKDVH